MPGDSRCSVCMQPESAHTEYNPHAPVEHRTEPYTPPSFPSIPTTSTRAASSLSPPSSAPPQPSQPQTPTPTPTPIPDPVSNPPSTLPQEPETRDPASLPKLGMAQLQLIQNLGGEPQAAAAAGMMIGVMAYDAGKAEAMVAVGVFSRLQGLLAEPETPPGVVHAVLVAIAALLTVPANVGYLEKHHVDLYTDLYSPPLDSLGTIDPAFVVIAHILHAHNPPPSPLTATAVSDAVAAISSIPPSADACSTAGCPLSADHAPSDQPSPPFLRCPECCFVTTRGESLLHAITYQ